MKLLGLVGSPRENGNTDILINRVMEGAASQGWETEKIRVKELTFAPCDGCMDCRKTAKCEIEDDIQKLAAKIDEADGLVVGAPVYGNHLPGHFKMLFDRLAGIIHNIMIKGPGKMEVTSRLSPRKRNVLVIAVAGAPREESCESTLRYLSRVLSPEANGGFVEVMPVIGLMGKGQILFSDQELMELAMRHRSPQPEETVAKMKACNEEYLKRAFRYGMKITEQ